MASCYRKAANLLEKSGWLKYNWHVPGKDGEPDSFCATGAINFLGLPRSRYTERSFFGGNLSLVGFNDSADSKEQVVSAMRGIARFLEHGGPLYAQDPGSLYNPTVEKSPR